MRLSKLMIAVAIVLGCLHSAASAQIGASVTYTSSQLGPSSYQYTFTLHNTGTTNIATFWVAWTAASYNNFGYAYDLFTSAPTATSAPSGWNGGAIQDSIFGGYAVEWYGFGTSLAAGNTLSNFTITTPESPATLAGASLIGVPVSTSWVYVGSSQDGGSISDQGALISPTAVPEPVVGLIAPIVLLGLRRRRVN